MKELKHPVKVYVCSIIFGCLLFATMDNISPWVLSDTFVEELYALWKSLLNGFSYIVAIGFFSFIGYLIMDLWVTNSKSSVSYNIKYVFVCIVAIIIIGIGCSQFA